MYGQATNAEPYIAAAYLIALILIGGYGAWLVLDRRRTHSMLKALKENQTSPQP